MQTAKAEPPITASGPDCIGAIILTRRPAKRHKCLLPRRSTLIPLWNLISGSGSRIITPVLRPSQHRLLRPSQATLPIFLPPFFCLTPSFSPIFAPFRGHFPAASPRPDKSFPDFFAIGHRSPLFCYLLN